MGEAIGANSLWAMEGAALAALAGHQAPSALPGILGAFLPSSGAPLGFAGSGEPPIARKGQAIVIPLQGTLSPKGSYGGTSTERFTDRVLAAGDDVTVGAIVLDVASAGGLLYGTAEAADAVYAVSQRKPVIAVANPYAYSAAHWIASQASAYYCTPSGSVGGMGVTTAHVDQSGLEAKLGIRVTLIASSAEKIAGNPHAPLSAVDRMAIQAAAGEAATAFALAVARGRGMRAADVAKVHGIGGTHLAARAAKRGMIDGTMALPTTVAMAAEPGGMAARLFEQSKARRRR